MNICHAIKREYRKKKPSNSVDEFVGWQKFPGGEIFALSNMTNKKHPLYRLIVSEKTLREKQSTVPSVPLSLEQLKRFSLKS